MHIIVIYCTEEKTVLEKFEDTRGVNQKPWIEGKTVQWQKGKKLSTTQKTKDWTNKPH